MLIGSRTFWHGISIHWEIRRILTLPNYQSAATDELQKIEKFVIEHKDPGWIWVAYKNACSESLDSRFLFYESCLPARHYRRTSQNFSMTSVDQYTLGAHASLDTCDTIFFNKGTIYALEEVAHALFCFPNNLLPSFTIDDSDDRPPLSFIPNKNEDQIKFAGDYAQAIAMTRDNAVTLHQHRSDIVVPDLPILRRAWINPFFTTFSLLSRDHDRQIFADNVSVLSSMWVIGHEDAHRYLGHLRYFDHALGAAGIRVAVFEELTASLKRDDLKPVRRAAELDADSAAAMRMVDFAFDAEFLGMFSDWMSVTIKNEIWRGTSQTQALDSRQRHFLIRLICLSCMIPVLSFQLNIDRHGSANQEHYPSLLMRLLNTILMVASRAMDVTLHREEYSVGHFTAEDILQYFRDAIADATFFSMVVRSIEDLVETGSGECETRMLFTDFPDCADDFFKLFFIYHDQAQMVGLGQRLRPGDFVHLDLVTEFVLLKYESHRHALDTFKEPRFLENKGREDKVEEDLTRDRKRLDNLERFFGEAIT